MQVIPIIIIGLRIIISAFKYSSGDNRQQPHAKLTDSAGACQSTATALAPKPFDNKPSHSTCCHLAIDSGTNIPHIQ